ncbi:MAG TPA: formate/nitrite transporter family protein [Pseudothermotoga sp.]|nr:formate/nitrite transporter family protein [Pseudothermotoga sp.]HOK82826.1 formate/nitrite transporter family protein [Pseudothermotoga sp.]HPP70000.1 formate/nitrite transporter family protein [Pseudothermotoga sp.]
MKTPLEVQKTIVEEVSVKKAKLSFTQMALLGILAGMYIGFGGIMALTAMTQVEPYGLKKVLGGAFFTVGLMLVIIAGAELFTGNVLMLTSLYARKISLRQMLRNWIVVYLFNFVGSLLIAWMLLQTNLWGMGQNINDFGKTAISVANSKVALGFSAIFFRGMLCNILVDLAVILALAADSVEGKILGIFFPIMTFVAIGFEHSVANMSLIPIGLFIKAASGVGPETLNWLGFWKNIIAATLGNIVGPGIFTALFYYLSYYKTSNQSKT